MTNFDLTDKPIIIIDDEEPILFSIDTTLRSEKYQDIITCQDSRHAMALIREYGAQVVLLDLTMPYVSGQELLEQIAAEFPDIPIIIITGTIDIETAIQCMKKGAFDYITKPIEATRLQKTVRQAISFNELRHENKALKDHILDEQLEYPDDFANIITTNHKMFGIFRYIEAIAKTSQVVLITGETGVGKELIARSLHTISGLKGKFVPVNIAGLDDVVFTDTLFGHIKGAFTGAEQDRNGLVEQASGGTLLLDEIGDLKSSSQIKLLRFLQESEYRSLGMDETRQANVRVVASTNKSITELKQDDHFRKDLLYRLQTHHIHIPALRERLDDIPYLLDHFIAEAADTFNIKKPNYPKELAVLLQNYNYPGNIREFKAMVFDAVSRHRSKTLSMKVFQSYINEQGADTLKKAESIESESIQFPSKLPTIEETTSQLLQEALKRANGNQSIVARLLGISQQAVSKRLKKNLKK
ncbi:MAG: sigma-54 dependent transcriptional regulator [Proteobacteria bacterium]|nr:sigma-54 dependent transcriptional regulator [Pseudomonadota bacterium]